MNLIYISVFFFNLILKKNVFIQKIKEYRQDTDSYLIKLDLCDSNATFKIKYVAILIFIVYKIKLSRKTSKQQKKILNKR